MNAFAKIRSRFPKVLPVVVVAIAALGGLGARTAYEKLSATSDCCYPGSPCCYPGAPCCVAREHAAQ